MKLFFQRIKYKNLLKNIIIIFLLLVLHTSCSNLFSDFMIDTELCYDQNKLLFIHTYKNGSLRTYNISFIGNKRLNKLDSCLNSEFFEYYNDTLIINLALMESQNRYFTQNLNQIDSAYVANIRNVRPVYPLRMFSNYKETFRIKNLMGLSFSEIEKKLKFIKIKYAISLEKQGYPDSLVKGFKLEKCCD